MPQAGTSSPPGRLAFGILALLTGLILAVFLWRVICSVPAFPWNPPRVAAAVAFAQGQNLYPLPTSGAQLGWFYPPAFAIWYSPVAVFSNPTVILVAAALWNFATIAGAFVALLRMAGLSWRATLAGTATGVGLSAAHSLTARAFFWVHVDVVCVAFGMVACGAIWRWVLTQAARWFHLAALAVMAAIFTKQIAAVLPVAIAVWLAVPFKNRLAAVRFLAWCFFYCALALAACAWRWSPDGVISSFFRIQARTPYQSIDRFIDEVKVLAFWSPLWIAAAWFLFRSRPPSPPGPTFSSLLLWVALAHVPLGLMAPLKAGGGLNSLHTIPYLAAWLALLAGQIWDAPQITPNPERVRLRLAVLWVVSFAVGHVHATLFYAEWRINRHQETLLGLAREHPGKFYAPWNPLITLLTEHRILPFDDALYCLHIAGMTVPREAVLAEIPHGAVVMGAGEHSTQFVLNYLFPPPPEKPSAAK